MKFKDTLWDSENRRHVLSEGDEHPERTLFEEDVDEVVRETKHPSRKMDKYESEGEPRVDMLGKTAHDRILFVTVAPKVGGMARPVGARDATEQEVRSYDGWLKSRRKR